MEAIKKDWKICLLYALVDPRGDQGNWSLPKIEHLNFWWQPGFYPALNYVIINIYFLISLFLVSFLNFNWKMTFFNRIFKPYLRLFSYFKVFTSFFDHYIKQNICFYSFRSSHWEIFYKLATPVPYISAEQIKLCLWTCSIFIKVAGCRLAALLEKDFFTSIFWRF